MASMKMSNLIVVRHRWPLGFSTFSNKGNYLRIQIHDQATRILATREAYVSSDYHVGGRERILSSS